MRRLSIGLALGVLAASAAALAGEVGFIEDFALAKDRAEALKQLIPGTEDYYFYHCLHAQNQGRLADVDEMLKAWIKRYDRTARVVEIENRQALLKYEKEPRTSLEYIRRQLGLQLNHQRELLGRKPELPTSLDPRLISRETLTQVAFQRHPGSLQGFEPRALEWLAGANLDANRRRHLLSRLKRPDLPNLPQLVVADLNHEHSGGFGSLEIHRLLLLAQLEECLKLKPDLLNQAHFVNAYLAKLRPSPDVDWRDDEAEREAYLDRMWAFSSKLAPVHNSLKAHVLYHRLFHDRAKGVYDIGRFLAYVQLPRNVGYMNPRYMEDQERRRFTADLGANFQQITLLPPVGNDEPLVRSYLMHIFVKANDVKPYDSYIHDVYLKHCFAETKIVNGLGDMEQWYSMLPASDYQALKERVDIDFEHTRKTTFAPEDKVALGVYIKNVKTLLVKVYELNAFNYYRERGREVDTTVNLDGLVANEEKTYTYDEPPLRRVRRTFEFPNLKPRGTYIIEFIGNGRSSRAVVRRGRLQYLARTSIAGQVFTILDEKNARVNDAALWLGGHKYAPDNEGLITVPFSNQPSRQPIILTQGDFACLDSFHHEAERYQLSASFYVDREALLKRNKATVLIRPMLYLNGTPVTLSVLEEVSLAITSTDREGVNTTKEAQGFKLFEDREAAYEFQVPANLARISFTLRAKVQNLSQNKRDDLSDAAAFQLNNIDATEKIEDLHLKHAGGQYAIEVLGRTGEARPDRPVSLAIKHRDFTDPVHVSLQSDARGAIALGTLGDIERVTATGPEGVTKSWPLGGDRHSYPRSLHGRAGAPIRIPYMGAQAKPSRDEVSFLERRGDTFLKDWFDALSIQNGFLVIQDVPAGDYDLLLKDTGERIAVRLTAGEEAEEHVLSKNRHLQVRNPKPLQIAAVSADKDTLTVRLENASKFARVHVFATRYMPDYHAYAGLGAAFPEPSVIPVPKTDSLYVEGRDIGEEYRYILERRQARRFPGNMLARPSLLLNPWAIRGTATETKDAAEGGEWAERAGRAVARHGGAGRSTRAPDVGPGDGAFFSNLDFLGEGAAVLANLRPDGKGVVAIKRADLGSHHQLRIVAVDPENTAFREVSLPEAPMRFEDLRLADGLDPARHFTEQKQITVVPTGERFTIADITVGDLERYDSIQGVFALYATLSANPTLAEFRFAANWPALKPEQKRELYSKYACHELNFFLHKKDPAFFEAVILPYLRNKRAKTFLDRWLLGEDLSAYLRPWAFGQLNAVERILLAQRVPGEAPNTARHVRDIFDLIPPDIERFNHLFNTALRGRALETRDALGVEKFKEQAKRLQPGEPLAKLAQVQRESLAQEAPAEPAAAPPPGPAPTTAAAPKAPPRALRDEARRADAKAEKDEDFEERELSDDVAPAVGYFAADLNRRKSVRQLYRKLDATQEWVENNYYRLPIEAQNASLVTVNAFWNDYAAHNGKSPFYSRHLAEASRNFTEMMLALAVLDLPFAAAEHKTDVQKARFTLTAASPMVVFHKEIREAQPHPDKPAILVSQNYYRYGERYRQVGNEQLDKYVTDEFLTHVPYGCHVVITNPTSSRQKLEILLQVPRGAIPLRNGQYTRSLRVDLEPYRTQTVDYFFYFPGPGKFAHYPVHVASEGKLLAAAQPASLNVVEKPTKIDTESWDYVSQHGTEDQVVAYLQANNLGRTNLDRIAWRMQQPAFFGRVTALLAQRHAYNHTLWSYALKHDDLPALREFLQHCDPFIARCGAYIRCRLLDIDPVVRKSYQHAEYWPLVNARAHRLGKARKILNDRFFEQYNRFLNVLAYRPSLDDDDLMSVTYYMLLQDRIEEALAFFARVDPKRLATRLQHDYFAAYLDFYGDATPQAARAIAARYADYPVDRWRNLFANVAAQLDELEGKGPKVVDKDDAAQKQAALAATEAAFDLKVEARKVTLNYQNLTEARVNYYLMDVELLFSRNPFVQAQSGQFAYIRPNETAVLKLDPAKATITFDLPEKFHNTNVMVEAIAGGMAKAQAYYANALNVQLIENYGQVRITHDATAKPLPKVYVKVYARTRDGQTRFYKDGYTDLRGRFDYASLSTNELDNVERFALLVLSDAHGALVRETAPPKR